MSAQSFVNQMAPYALEAQNATGLNATLILAQWGNETGVGHLTSAFARRTWQPRGYRHHLRRGVGAAPTTGPPRQWGPGVHQLPQQQLTRYQAVKAIGPNKPQAHAVALGNSGWAAGGYNDGGGPGSSLIADMQSFQAPQGVAPANLSGATGGGQAQCRRASPEAAAAAPAIPPPVTHRHRAMPSA